MVRFEINLIRDEVLEHGQREAVFWSMIGYLLVCGLAGVGLAYRAASTVETVERRIADVTAMEQFFLKEHPRAGGILEFVRSRHRVLEQRVEAMEAIRASLAGHVSLARIFASLSAPLPPGAYILSLEMEDASKVARFSVAIPAADGEMTAADLTGQWGKDGSLMEQLREIRSLVSQRQRVDGKSMLIMRFSAPLKEGQ